ncbi:MAG: ribonuclease H [Candidatus Absconditabacterales bacterium]
MSDYSIYTDGACSGNPGPGGRGAVVLSGGVSKDVIHLSGKANPSTNNQMELTAVIRALEWICQKNDIVIGLLQDYGGLFGDISSQNNTNNQIFIDIYLDSTYVKHGIQERIHTRKRNGRKTTGRQLVKNIELRQELDILVGLFTIHRHRVKGHNGNKYNEMADRLATGRGVK